MGVPALSSPFYMTGWGLAKLHWKVQALANILFGFSLAVALLKFLDFSWNAIVGVGIVYLSVYLLIFVPLFGILPVVLFRKVLEIASRARKGERVEETEAIRAIEILLNTPLLLSMIVAVGALAGFVMGVGIIRIGAVPELRPAINVISIAGVALGLVVGMVHGFLNFIFLEAYLHPVTEAFASLYPRGLKKLAHIRRNPLFLKVFILAFFSTMAGIISIGTLFLSKIAVRFPWELNESILYTVATMTISVILIFVIAARFTLNIILPFQKLSQWSRAIIEGNLEEQAPIVTNDEVFDVVSNVAHMVDELRDAKAILEIRVSARTQELREMTENLEAQVSARTKELQDKISELERFQKLAVGRELKMIELKHAIGELERRKPAKKGGAAKKPRRISTTTSIL